MNRKIPFFSLKKEHHDLEKDLTNAFLSVLHSNMFILGKNLAEFEKAFADYIGTNYAIGVGNGYDALRISLKSLELKKGDEVIIPAHTFIATVLAVLHADLKPVLVDVEPNGFTLDPQEIRKKINRRTKVVLPVHLYGYPCDLDSILEISAGKDIILVEDFAQSVGAVYKQRKTGSIGRINAASFYPVKTLGALGDGGVITTDDKQLAERSGMLRNYGNKNKYVNELPGYNSRLDDLQASFLMKKLSHLDQYIYERNKIAQLYDEYIKGIESVKLPSTTDGNGTVSACHIYPILTENRDQLKLYLEKQGIETQIHYPIPPHLQPSIKNLNFKKGDFPVTEKICQTELSLPLYPGLRREDILYIADSINNFFSH